MAEAVLAVPAAAMGVLGFIGTCIGRQSYWRETYRVLAAPSLLSLLSIIVACHPPMHPQVRLWRHVQASPLPAPAILVSLVLLRYSRIGSQGMGGNLKDTACHNSHLQLAAAALRQLECMNAVHGQKGAPRRPT